MADSGLIAAQIGFIVVIYIMAFVSGILPNIIPWCKKSTDFLGIANAFSGGVFIAIAFMHILPEASSGYIEYMEDHDHPDPDKLTHGDDEDPFPLPFVLVFVGYAFILLIDKVIFDTHSLIGEHHHGHVHDPAAQKFIGDVKNHLNEKLIPKDQDSDLECVNQSEQVEGDVKAYLSRNEKFAVRMHHALNPENPKKRFSKSFNPEVDRLEADPAEGKQEELIEPIEEAPQKKKACGCNLTPVVLMIALSTHAVFEGIATGLVDNVSEVWTYIIAITLHKWAAAMSLGISMNKNFKDEKYTMYLLLFIFAFATPLGVAIGMCVSGTSELTEIIFNSLAAGTFVYIACSEVIVEEFSVQKYKWFKMFAFILGAAMITCLTFIEG